MNCENMVFRIDALCSVKGIKKQTAYIESGVGKDFGINIKKGSSPSIDKIVALADYFGVSVDYLLGRTENPTPDPETEEFVRLFLQLSPEKRKAFLAFLREFGDKK